MSKRAAPKRKAATAAEHEIKRAKGETDLFNLKWYEHGEPLSKGFVPLVYLYGDTLPGCSKIAAFDMDSTLINVKSGAKFAKNHADWVWWHQTVPKKLAELHKEGYRLIIFTNQAGIEKQHTKLDDIKRKCEKLIEEISAPMYVYIATGENHFRKPATSMYDFFVENCNQNVDVDKKNSFYCGDAAGRVNNWLPGKKKDFSCADRKYAHNIGLSFKTPEEVFLDEAPTNKFEWGSINPSEYVAKLSNGKTTNATQTYHKTTQELVILQGPPASGKSTFSRRYFKPYNYEIINRDTLITPAKCLKAATDALKNGKSVVVDNTNPGASTRSEYIALAKSYKVPCRCFVLNTPIELCHHLNYVRVHQTAGDVRRIPDVGYNMYKKNYEAPKTSEGLGEIIHVDFVPNFDSETHEKIFHYYTES
ncbi:unnamed protein product [Rotaria magnacalcarata]|uniref:Bifunctional polynucleotide phosphatase/kinase n=3 Tax=Rotaria magnacalcarata TaxID=392030 RepID=A0A815JRZ5_9BILA|nr:unnamed protein product [Rotaria magnacalcarata]CAF1386018.1 unnamed protein product [Rotaria magnacalcarata]CAF2089555.1 unnamed protein product [Rotaria magnacalcarata]CAF2118501.1 unnamed protein product [Rotaria magnacalcarata]CAF2138829.1 unnamed protein product [Rotaria magnacalcarata]